MGIYNDMNVIRVPEEEEKADQAKKSQRKNNPENFPNLGKEIHLKSSRRNPKKSTPGHSIIKLLMPKDKEKNLASKET